MYRYQCWEVDRDGVRIRDLGCISALNVLDAEYTIADEVRSFHPQRCGLRAMSRDLQCELLDLQIRKTELARLYKHTKDIGEDDVAYVVKLRQDVNAEAIAAVRREIQERAESQVVKALQVFPVM
jgi:hypothetical protein